MSLVNPYSDKQMEAAMAAKRPPRIESRITSGNLWTIAVMVAGIVGGTGYQHYVPSEAAAKSAIISQAAVDKAADAAAKAAVLESTVSTHTQELNSIASSIDTLRIDVAVLKSQGSAAQDVAKSQSDKLDRLLGIMYRQQNSPSPR